MQFSATRLNFVDLIVNHWVEKSTKTTNFPVASQNHDEVAYDWWLPKDLEAVAKRRFAMVAFRQFISGQLKTWLDSGWA